MLSHLSTTYFDDSVFFGGLQNKFRLWCDCWLFSHSSGPVPHGPLAFAHGDVIANFNQGLCTPVVGKWIFIFIWPHFFFLPREQEMEQNVAVRQRHLSVYTSTSLVSHVRRVSCVRLPFFFRLLVWKENRCSFFVIRSKDFFFFVGKMATQMSGFPFRSSIGSSQHFFFFFTPLVIYQANGGAVRDIYRRSHHLKNLNLKLRRMQTI